MERTTRGPAEEINLDSIKPGPYRARVGLTRRRRKQRDSLIAWRKVVGAIAKRGFLKEADIPWRFAVRLTDPKFVNPPARIYALSGISHLSGGRHTFSTIDLLGKQLYRTQYIVVNEEKFKGWASSWMETRFRLKNPHPNRFITAAFTNYMHDNNLHWSGCTDRQRKILDIFAE